MNKIILEQLTLSFGWPAYICSMGPNMDFMEGVSIYEFNNTAKPGEGIDITSQEDMRQLAFSLLKEL